MRTPVIAVTGVTSEAIEVAAIGLLWDLPRAVAVQHTFDPEAQMLTRVVSDAAGVVERHQVQLAHACTTCALREDILPTILRLARSGRYESIVVVLPVAAPADQLGTSLNQDPRLARYLRLSSTLVVVEGASVVADLLGDDLLAERGLQHGPDDNRGVGEVACALIEYADTVVLTSPPDTAGEELIANLARPDAAVVMGVENLSGSTVVEPRHSHLRATNWASPVVRTEVTDVAGGASWRIVLSSARPFHPDRLLDGIDRLGSGAFRTRGCFWLPTRPHEVQQWDGAGGQLSIGTWSEWHQDTPRTQLIFTGVGTPPAELVAVFEGLLISDADVANPPPSWAVLEDGFEPWLGPVENVA